MESLQGWRGLFLEFGFFFVLSFHSLVTPWFGGSCDLCAIQFNPFCISS